MRNNRFKWIIVTAAALMVFISAQTVSAQVTISLVPAADKSGNTVLNTVSQGNEFYVLVKVSDAATLGGAALTLSYSTDVFEIPLVGSTDPTATVSGTMQDVESDLFTTFTAQNGDSDNPRIGNVDDANGKVLLSGAYIDTANNGDGAAAGEKILFKVPFRVKSTAVDGSYSITPEQTVLNNPDAGWNGEAVHPLVGIDPDWENLALADQFVDISYSFASANLTVQTDPGEATEVTHTYGTGLNLVPFTISGTAITKASEWATQIETNNPGYTVKSIFGWNPINQQFSDAYLNLGGGTIIGELDLIDGVSYFVEIGGTGTSGLTLSGYEYNYIHFYQGLNLMSVPVTKSISTATALANEIESRTGLIVKSIFGWNPSTQQYTAAYLNLGGGTIIDGLGTLNPETEGYFIEVDGEGYYYP